MLTYLIIALSILLYFAIGIAIAGYIFRDDPEYEDHILSTCLIVCIWPMMVVAFIGLWFVLGSYRLGKYIGRKIHTR